MPCDRPYAVGYALQADGDDGGIFLQGITVNRRLVGEADSIANIVFAFAGFCWCVGLNHNSLHDIINKMQRTLRNIN